MILYDAEDTASLEAYGIQIPVHKSKAAGTLEVLRSHPLLGPKAREWQVQTRPMDITGQDLLSFHMIRDLGHRDGDHLVQVGLVKFAIDGQDLPLPPAQA